MTSSHRDEDVTTGADREQVWTTSAIRPVAVAIPLQQDSSEQVNDVQAPLLLLKSFGAEPCDCCGVSPCLSALSFPSNLYEPQEHYSRNVCSESECFEPL